MNATNRAGIAAAALTAWTIGGFGAPALAQSDESVEVAHRRCLALAMYFEARSEGVEGMRAVGSVVLNRVESDEFPSSPCAVVHQGGETPPCQFSWWCDGRSDAPKDEELWQEALELASRMLKRRGADPTDGALFFHSSAIAVPWRVERQRTVQILGHVYYR